MRKFTLPILIFGVIFLRLIPTTSHAGTDYTVSSGEGYDTIVRAASGSGSWLAGDSTQTVGDINGDGIDDLIFSSYESGHGAYIIFGKEGDLAATIDLSSDYNIKLDPPGALDKQSIQSGDINGDGKKDLIIGSADGSIYVFFSTFWEPYGSTTGNLLNLTNSANYNIRYSGVNVVTSNNWQSIFTYDVNQDGKSDLLINNPSHSSSSGALYVLFSTMLDDISGTGNNLTLTTSTSYNIRYVGTANSMIGRDGRVAFGDVNGDGFGDILLSSDNITNGAVWVIFSDLVSVYQASDHVDLSLSDSANYSVRYTGHDDLQKVSSPYVSDVNGDGKGDLIMGANGTDFGGAQSGSFYILFSDKVNSDLNSSVSLSSASSYNIRIDGKYAQDDLGWPYTISFGDFNGNQKDDIIIVAYLSDPNGVTDAGELYYISAELISSVGTSTGNQWSLANSTSFNLNIEHVFQNNYLGYVSTYSKASVSGNYGGSGDDFLMITYELETVLNGGEGGAILMESDIFAPYTTTGNTLLLTNPNAYTYRWNGDDSEGKFQDGGVNFGDINGDGIGDLFIFDTKEENYDGAVYIKYGGSVLENVPSGLSVVLASDPTVNVEQVRQAGEVTVRVMSGSQPVAEVQVDFENPDLDWSALTAGGDSSRSVVSGLASIASAGSTHALLIPKTTGSNQVQICPDATTIEQVTESCANGYTLTESDSSLSTVTIGAENYWRVTGLTSTGGVSLVSAAPPTTPTDPDPTSTPESGQQLANTGNAIYPIVLLGVVLTMGGLKILFTQRRDSEKVLNF